jgi:hypothetical protein
LVLIFRRDDFSAVRRNRPEASFAIHAPGSQRQAMCRRGRLDLAITFGRASSNRIERPEYFIDAAWGWHLACGEMGDSSGRIWSSITAVFEIGYRLGPLDAR